MVAIYMLWRGSYDQGDNDRRLSWSAFDGRGTAPHWSQPIVLGDRASFDSPALAVFQDKLYAACRGAGAAADDQSLYWFALELHEGVPTWSQPNHLGDRASFLGPALAVFQNKLHMAWRGVETDHNLYWATFDGQGNPPQWSSWCALENRGSIDSPALAVFQNKLFMAWRGVNEDRTLYWATFDGNSPSLPCAQQWSPQRRKDDRGSATGPALVVFRDQLFMFWRGVESDTSNDQRLYFATFDGQPDWSGQKFVGPLQSFRKPGVVSFRNKLYIADMGTVSESPGGREPPGAIVDAILDYTTFDGENPQVPMLAVGDGATSVASPAMAVFPEVTKSLKLFLLRHGFDPAKGVRQVGTGSVSSLMGLT
jgi:hypothetical protein